MPLPIIACVGIKNSNAGTANKKKMGKGNGPYKVNERGRIPQTNEKIKGVKTIPLDVGEILSHAGQEEENVYGK